jgi:predicted helicase
LVRELAKDIVKSVPERNYAMEIKAVHEWVSKHKRFTRDPYGIELIASPRRLAYEYHKRGKILADCEELSPLEASLLGALGHKTRVILIDANPWSREFSHAVAQVRYGGNWIWLDPTRDGKVGAIAAHTRELVIEPEVA